jgi:hypothetical protein
MERPENFQFDTRLRLRLLARGQITQSQVDSHLGSLSDREGQFVVLDGLPQPAVSPPPRASVPPGPPPTLESTFSPAAAPLGSERFVPASEPDDDEAPLTPVMVPREMEPSWADRREASSSVPATPEPVMDLSSAAVPAAPASEPGGPAEPKPVSAPPPPPTPDPEDVP